MTWKHLRGEINAHIEEKALDLIENGVPESEAWEQARREFGNATRAIESSREVWAWQWIEQLVQDVGYALRSMNANRPFTALAVISLALGIGANTAIYSFMDAILLRSLPVENPESLVVLKFQRPSKGGSKGKVGFSITSGGSRGGIYSVFPYPAFEMFQARSELFSSLFAYKGQKETRLIVNRDATLGDCVYVSGDYFPGLGTQASVGRVLTGDDDQPGAPPAALISTGFAQQWYGDPTGALGKTVGINGQSFTIVGITPPGFFGVNPEWSPDVYLPLHSYLSTQPARFSRDGKLFSQTTTYFLDVMGRLKPGVTREQAQAALNPAFAEFFRENSGDTPEKARMVVMAGAGGLDSLRLRYSKPLYVLMVMVILMLAIACANIANLLLARASARRREMAVRLSMGAGRLRVIRQLLTESLVLAFTGGVLGLLIASWGVRMLTALLAMGREDFTLRAELSWPVLAMTFALAVATGLIFGLAPAWQSTKVDVYPALRELRASIRAPRRRWLPVSLGQALIVAQITLSLLLLIGAGLFVRTLSKLQSLELGFNRENLLLLEVNTQQAGYKGPASIALHEVLRQRMGEIPGVRNATLAAEGQLDGGSWDLPFTVPGTQTEEKVGTPLLPVGPDYLTTMQIPILLGRDIRVEDAQRKPIAAVVSESFAKQYFGADNPVGRRVLMTFDGEHELEIVGVAKDARYGTLKEAPRAMLYVDYRQTPGFLTGVIRIVLRTVGNPTQVANAARETLRQADPGVPMGMVSTQAAQIDSTINQEIIFARLCTLFAVLALLIACVGLYGTTSYNVARRTSEIGIRMALGAQRGTVLAMVLREVATLGLVALAIGIPIALGVSKLLAAFLFDLQPNDPSTIGAAIGILLAAALLAAYAPAQRAARIDPMTALRHE
jgi:macrolide transport system ATP-binding/permease protein